MEAENEVEKKKPEWEEAEKKIMGNEVSSLLVLALGHSHSLCKAKGKQLQMWSTS